MRPLHPYGWGAARYICEIPYWEYPMGSAVPLSPDSINTFSSKFGGDLIHPGSSTYDAARSVWNGMIDRRPAVIARCKTVEDVQNAIRFARDENLPIAIRGGGHNAAG